MKKKEGFWDDELKLYLLGVLAGTLIGIQIGLIIAEFVWLTWK